MLSVQSEQIDADIVTDLRRRVYKEMNELHPDVVVEPPSGRIVVVSYNDDYETALAKLPQGKYSILGISFLWDSKISSEKVYSTVLQREFTVIPLSKLKGLVYAKKFVIYPSRENRIETQYFRTRRILSRHGVKQYSILESDRDFVTAKRFVPASPKVFSVNVNRIATVYGMLASERERDMYLRYIIAMLTRNKSYIRLTQAVSYRHPIVTFNPGDIVLDSGVSESVSTCRFISERCGENGKIFAFEPDPFAYESANQALSREKLLNYHLVKMGVWDKSETAYVARKVEGRSAIILSQRPDESYADVEECSLITIDDFVSQQNLDRVDAIKMDIEGAEPQALIGAENTIKNFKPKLFISIYHDFTHLFEIPLLIKRLNPGYRFYLEQHSWNLYDLTLFAINTNESVL